MKKFIIVSIFLSFILNSNAQENDSFDWTGGISDVIDNATDFWNSTTDIINGSYASSSSLNFSFNKLKNMSYDLDNNYAYNAEINLWKRNKEKVYRLLKDYNETITKMRIFLNTGENSAIYYDNEQKWIAEKSTEINKNEKLIFESLTKVILDNEKSIKNQSKIQEMYSSTLNLLSKNNKKNIKKFNGLIQKINQGISSATSLIQGGMGLLAEFGKTTMTGGADKIKDALSSIFLAGGNKSNAEQTKNLVTVTRGVYEQLAGSGERELIASKNQELENERSFERQRNVVEQRIDRKVGYLKDENKRLIKLIVLIKKKISFLRKTQQSYVKAVKI